jgi:penicillin-binding protein 1C
MKRCRKWLKHACWLPGGAVLLWLGWLALPAVELLPANGTWSRRVMDREGKLLTVTLAADGRYRLWTGLAELPPDLVRATLAHEDHRFHQHPGVDLRSVARAAWGVVRGEKRGGGSTITMQLARLRFGLETRNWSGKLTQMFRALQLERHYDKDRILEAYLNLAPYGGNVEGAGTASWVWLGKSPADLTFRECVALSLVPQRPARRNPARTEADSTAIPLQRTITARLRGGNDSGEASYQLRAVTRPPHHAPHFTRQVLRETPGAVVQTPLDSGQQNVLENGIADFLREAGQEGVHNACALLVHAPTREVRAWVGSASFGNKAIHGQVDGVTARRSPGSLLKPFIYGLAIHQGLIHPGSLLADAPAVFAGYQPENSDRGFAGPLSAADALYRSRNLPAVRLLQQLKAPDFYTFLTGSGVHLPHPARHYGLALALGSQEVSMRETAALYAMLAHEGKAHPLRLTTTAPVQRMEKELLPAGVRFLVRDMLRPRQPGPAEETYTASFPQISWKTGTSHGWRDGWAAAIAGDYVLVVWTGDFRGRSNPAFAGRRTAGPLLFSLLGALNLPTIPDPAPPDVSQVRLCAVSGDLPGPCCAQFQPGWYLPGISPIRPCAIHQEILTDSASGRRVASDDGRPGLRRETAEVWPPNLLALFRQAGVPRREPPAWETATAAGARAPLIASPQAARTYTLRAGDPARRSIALLADAAPGVQQVYWFAGAEFLGAAVPSSPCWWAARPGITSIRVVDDQGRSASLQVRVELIP